MVTPVYTLTCHSDAAAKRLAETVRTYGYFHAEITGAVVSFPWGGGLERLIQIGDLARLLEFAGDIEVSEMYMQYMQAIQREAS